MVAIRSFGFTMSPRFDFIVGVKTHESIAMFDDN